VLRQDFRRDLAVADILKSFPMRGWQIVLGELLAPAAILTGIQWLLIIAAAALVTRVPQGEMVSWPARLAFAAGAAIVVPMLNFVSLIIRMRRCCFSPAGFKPTRRPPWD
jgi:hypothetical protein